MRKNDLFDFVIVAFVNNWYYFLNDEQTQSNK